MSEKASKRKDNRRDHILDAAAAEFSKGGYNGTSVRDIAAAAGMLPGSLYYHFASKEDLLGAVHEAGIARIKERVLAAIAGEIEPWARLEAACAAHLSGLHLSKEYGSVIATELPSRHSRKLRTVMVRQRDDYEAVFRALIDDLPLPKSASRKYLRLSMIGAMNWTLAWYRAGEDTPESIAHSIVGLFRGADGPE